jgi:hypothetical protein
LQTRTLNVLSIFHARLVLTKLSIRDRDTLVSEKWLFWRIIFVSSSPHIEVIHERVLFDEEVAIRVSSLRPDQIVTIRARTKDALSNPWESYATFKTDLDGIIDLSSQKPLHGTYDGVDSIGLFWPRTTKFLDDALKQR